MEDNVNNVTPEIKSTPKKSNTVLMVTLIVIGILVVPTLIVLGIALASTAVFENIKKSNVQELIIDEDMNNESKEDIDTQEIMAVFNGQVVTTSYPQGWSVREYFNGDGTDILTKGVNYTGLTGLKIFKNNTEKFFVKAVYGIGFSGCPTYARFEDENPSYYSQIEIDNQEIGDTTDVLDYTNTDYIEFDWLGTTFRRIGSEYHYDIREGNNYFESACVPSLVTLEGLSFTSDGQLSEAYSYDAVEGISEDDLLIIDDILSNMEIVD